MDFRSQADSGALCMWAWRRRDHIEIPEPEAFDLPLHLLQPERLAHERDDLPGFKQRAQFVIGEWGAVGAFHGCRLMMPYRGYFCKDEGAIRLRGQTAD